MSNPYGGGQPGDQYGQNPYGGQPANPYGAPYGGQQGAAPAKTDGVSVAALILSLLCCTSLIGLILGFVGLGRTSGGQRKGRGLAIAAVVLGGLGTLGGIGVGIALATTDLSDVFDYRTINDLEDGQCINADGLTDESSTEVGSILVVDCGEAHDGEVVGTTELSEEQADEFEFNNQQQIREYCDAMLPGEVAADVNKPDPTYFLYLLTDSATPASGDKAVCVVTRADGDQLTEKLG